MAGTDKGDGDADTRSSPTTDGGTRESLAPHTRFSVDGGTGMGEVVFQLDVDVLGLPRCGFRLLQPCGQV